MSREVRRVPAGWEHPKDEKGYYIPHNKCFSYSRNDVEEGLRDGWLDNSPPYYGCNVMPQWHESERTHYQMYEIVTEGTPISPVMESPEALARWLADNKASAGPYATATYDLWLAMIKAGLSVNGFVVNCHTGEITSGVKMVSVMKGKQ